MPVLKPWLLRPARRRHKSCVMEKHTEIPTKDGLYWYYEQGEKEPRPIQIDQGRYGRKFKSFNGSEQSWVRPGEYFIGPLQAPVAPQ
jgi:hypothetical protein